MTVVPIAQIARVTATELRRQKQRVSLLEDTVGSLTQSTFDSTPAADLATLQEFDILTQSMESLIAYLEILSETMPSDLHMDTTQALGALPLRDLADRLAGRTEGQISSCGSVDLF